MSMSHQYVELATTVLNTILSTFIVWIEEEELFTLVHCFVLSRMDYLKSLLYGTCDYNLNVFNEFRMMPFI